jgi:MoaA/NifB/PqqE/SkfB family radical SAM enzyme
MKFMHLVLAYLGREGTIRLVQDGRSVDSIQLREGWQECSVKLPTNGDWFGLEVDPIHSVATDCRELGVMLRSMLLFDDEQSFARSRARSDNALLNDSEFRQGYTVLASHPTSLRVTTEVRCNIPETTQACAYCPWDWAKTLEKGSPPFDTETPDQLGVFYRDAERIGDCSIGEPMMNKDFEKILRRFHDDGKEYSFTTNGQLLGQQQRRKLLGRNIELYVSIDAATSDGYKRYRNDKFDVIISNLKALCAEKRQHQNLPKVTVSFLAMRSNIDELEAFFDLMTCVGVDQVKLRTLNVDDIVMPTVTNNGYRFEYMAEVLSVDELRSLGSKTRRMAEERNVTLYIDWEQFETERMHQSGEPLCAEPWKTLYVLRRGIMPCSFASEPIAKWEDQGNRSLDQFLCDIFNSPEYQHLRSELAAGRLSDYCRNTPSCPVLKRLGDVGPRTPLAESLEVRR